MFEPRFETFAATYGAGTASLVSTKLVGDLETPVSAYLKLAGTNPARTFLLESVEGGANRGRYSMIGLDPDIIWKAEGSQAFLNRTALTNPEGFELCPQAPLDALRALIAESAIPEAPNGQGPHAQLPPMAAGVFGYLGYEMVRQMERLPEAKPDKIGVPDAIMIRPTIMVVFDSVRDEIAIITPVRPQDGITAKMAYEAALDRLERIVQVLEGPLSHAGPVVAPNHVAPEPTSNTSPHAFLDMVAKAKEYIRAGDIFQVVLSQRFSAPFDLPPFSLYRALRRVNPAPFLCYLDFGPFQIVCSSPEILVRVREGRVTVRPIAGTRWRGKTVEEDVGLAEELLADPKERSEHLMLLDLGRNDVGRVAQIGSVEVTAQFQIERYSHVMHIVSQVEGQLDPKHDVIDALSAGFPAGTVSGAPKVRAMEIIDEFETDRRGIYAGCIGYFGASGEMDTCIVLRTAIVKDGQMHVQAGAGIVYDSDPQAEHNECVNKGKALFRAAEEALRFAARAGRGQ